MSVELILPKWGLTMEDGTVVAWHVAEGDTVSEGEVVADIETEKVENELESPCDGVVAKILVEEDDTVDVGTVLMLIASDADEAASMGGS
ncbi:MAG: biotin attachment protein [Actinobacteria bacterium]|nr:MAG: biotin attachment protein [Actinomycetota bacterium]